MVEVMKIKVTSLKSSHACTATSVPPTLQQATTDPFLHRRLPDTHRQVQDSLLWGRCFFLLGSGTQGSVLPSKSLFPVWFPSLYPMNSMKMQKDRTLKDELPRLVAAQYVTGDQWRNNPGKNEETEPKQKQHPVVDVTGDGSKVWCCKEQYCKGT